MADVARLIPLPEPGPGEIRIRVNGLVDAANEQALVLGAIADGGRLVEVRGWAGPSKRTIAVHTIVAHSVASDTSVSNRLAPLPNQAG
jgi:hypothetical protein